MKRLNEYLSTKVNVNKGIFYNGFPKKFVIDDIINFLQEHGFEACLYNALSRFTGLEQFNNISKAAKTPMFMLPYEQSEMNRLIHSSSLWIRLADKGEINSENQSFFISIPKNEDFNTKPYNSSICLIEKNPHSTLSSKTYNLSDLDNFLEDINNYFGWNKLN